MLKASRVLQGEFLNQSLEQLETSITEHYCVDEEDLLRELLPLATPGEEELRQITQSATELVQQVRADDDALHSIDKLLQEYGLDNQEGIILMCLAEALLRIPDADTADALIRDKLSGADWKKHLKQSDSILVNASTWGLMLTGRVVSLDKEIEDNPNQLLKRLINRWGEPVIRQAMYQAMKIMGKQFVLGRTIDEAIRNGESYRKKGYCYSYDMLGEAAFTASDAQRYFDAYRQALEVVGQASLRPAASAPCRDKPLKPTLSIKLSALHPRYDAANQDRVFDELGERLQALLEHARRLGVGITVDAEEADRLELSLQLFKRVYRSPCCRGWGDFGLAVQAYSKRALPVLCWLTRLADLQGDRIPVRLVKGAYWDSEIKHAQQLGLDGYPVFTRKEGTDTAYLACARFLLSPLTEGRIYPQFATHNAHTVACIRSMAAKNQRAGGYEFQRLHGMGDALYDRVLEAYASRCRIYAPVGAHKELLPYLVRRLLENGANSSFVHRLVDARTPVEELVQHPVARLTRHSHLANQRIPQPSQIFGATRRNSQGINLNVQSQYRPLIESLQAFDDYRWQAAPLLAGERRRTDDAHPVCSPYDKRQAVGTLYRAGDCEVNDALDIAQRAFPRWNATAIATRATCLARMADLLEKHRPELMALCCREAGKTLQDGIDEVREAVDFCRYYAGEARRLLGPIQDLPGPTGESNQLYLQGRGIFVCISPWNFPLAIFLGQVSAALVAGNPVIAKPAEQTSLIAYRAVQLFHEAGIPGDVLQLIPGKGSEIGPLLTADPRVAGVAFTGSTATAHHINRSLAARDSAIAAFIAETGGQNAMIVDSTALPEQVVADVVHSAFTSAGQRCSALRVLYVQADIAERVIELIRGSCAELTIGHPGRYQTDVGPVIDSDACGELRAHIAKMQKQAKLLAQRALPESCEHGHFVPPTAFEIQSMTELQKEHFGPILHVVRYRGDELDRVIDEVNASGYGLTLGIHTRNEATARYIDARVRVGNVYINRNQIGAVVGVQPFGGLGLSGTGPKAGGPHYLLRFATERTRSTNTAAVGGNAALLSLADDTGPNEVRD